MATALGVHPRTIARWVKQRSLPVNIGKNHTYYFDFEKVQQWMRNESEERQGVYKSENI
ncbi:helix-turn-helix domain-containing protein [Aneurinibacillus sp. Ricciae_BoGa-3]|uniref:helix-turn-helix domain-containing protein n=1 Tax=Aneurinibacillus sp. Ricciae_BoGa-3 TaxID=3022697 RepID=UPI003FA43936